MSATINGKTDITPEEACFNPDFIKNIETHYEQLIEKGTIAGAGYLIARGGRVFAHSSLGNRNVLDPKQLLQPDSIKSVASITKMFTATAIMQLVETGKLWLEQTVASIIPEFDKPGYNTINLRHLLTHTSGISADSGYFCEAYPIDTWDIMQTPEWLTKCVLAGVPRTKPGEEWSYSTKGFSVLGEIITRASGIPAHQYIEEYVFKAAGMNRSFMDVPEALWNECVIIADWSLESLKSKVGPGCAPNCGGGAWSTLSDLFTFAQFFLNGGSWNGKRLLSRKSVEEMMRNQLSGVPAFHWGKNIKDMRSGLGWGMFCDGTTTGQETVNHEGWGWSSMFVDPVEDFVFVAIVNNDGDWSPDVQVKPRVMAFSGIL